MDEGVARLRHSMLCRSFLISQVPSCYEAMTDYAMLLASSVPIPSDDTPHHTPDNDNQHYGGSLARVWDESEPLDNEDKPRQGINAAHNASLRSLLSGVVSGRV